MKALQRAIIKALLGIALIVVCVIIVLAMLAAIAFRDRRQPIYFAVEKGDTNEIAKYLASGADVNKPVISYPAGHRYASLLNVAVVSGQAETVDLLLKSGANPNQPDGQGDTPLITAISAGRSEADAPARSHLVRMLLKAGADPNLRAFWEYNATPLMKAASFGAAEMVSILLAAGANVNATNKIGQSALHLASTAEVARLLIAAGANSAARAASCETPADFANRVGHSDVLSLLTNAPWQTNAVGKGN